MCIIWLNMKSNYLLFDDIYMFEIFMELHFDIIIWSFFVSHKLLFYLYLHKEVIFPAESNVVALRISQRLMVSLRTSFHKSEKVLLKHSTQLFILSKDCEKPDYVKLVKALSDGHKVTLLIVPNTKTFWVSCILQN